MPTTAMKDAANDLHVSLSGCRLEGAHQRLVVGMSLLSPGYAEALRHL